MAFIEYYWSDDLPTEPGWYWFRSFYHGTYPDKYPDKIYHVEVDPITGKGMISHGLLFHDVEELPGKWCGPIEEPLEKEE